MKTVKSIYAWEVIIKLKEGKTVCVCDRQFHSCDTVNELTVKEAIAILNDAAEHQDCYDFWIEEESEEVENE